MRIGLNALWLLPGMVGGAETYLRGLLSGFAEIDGGNEYVVFTNRENHATFAGLPANFRRVAFDHSARWNARSLAMIRGLGEQVYLPWRAARERVDVLHFPLDIAPLKTRCPVALTIHDLNFSAVHETTSRVARRLSEAFVRASARRADAVLTVSQFSRGQICKQLGVSPDRVWVTYNAPARRPRLPESAWPALAARLGLRPPFILGLSSLNEHKNIAVLLRAFALLDGGPVGQLVIAGHLPQTGPALPRLARELGVAARTVFTGYLKDAELRALLERARVFALPSLFEGFGIPVVEAMEAGVPVACSNAAALPEVAGGAALLFDPRRPEQLARCLEALCSDEALRRRLVEKGRANAARFSWRECARRTLSVYEALA